MKKLSTTFLLLVLMLMSALPLRPQTRPRRVTQQEATSAPVVETVPRRRESRGWMRVLRGVGASIGSCTPSRERIGRRPRVEL
jgi:hypothetical protein